MSDLWSRRRAAVQAEEQAQVDAARAALAAEQEAQLEARSDEALLAEAGLPDPDTLVSAEQVKAFLRAALPQRLKRRALRKLWGMNPVLACLDGLNDYDDDFTDAACAVTDIKTVYKVGIGMIDRLATVADAVPDVAAPEDDPEADPEPAEASEPVAAEPVEDAPEPVRALSAETDAPPPAPRRMRFDFETGAGKT